MYTGRYVRYTSKYLVPLVHTAVQYYSSTQYRFTGNTSVVVRYAVLIPDTLPVQLTTASHVCEYEYTACSSRSNGVEFGVTAV